MIVAGFVVISLGASLLIVANVLFLLSHIARLADARRHHW
jgi:hypothetical protein